MDWDVKDGWKQLQDWILHERLGRWKYVEIVILTAVIGFAAILAPFFLIFVLPDFNSNFLELPIAAVGIAVAIIMILIYCAASVARLRDMGYMSHWFILGLIPYVNVVFFILLALREGEADRKGAK